MLAALLIAHSGTPRAGTSLCVDCAGAPCLSSACHNGTCVRGAMVAHGRAAGYAMEVPERCELRRLYRCGVSSGRSSNTTGENATQSFRCELATTPAASLIAGAAAQLYPPEYMRFQNRPRYFTIPKMEHDAGITYDSNNPGPPQFWVENYNAYDFTPQPFKPGGFLRGWFADPPDYLSNHNSEGTGKMQNVAGWGLSTEQWLVLLTLLYLNGNHFALVNSLLPLAVVAMAPALLPGWVPPVDRVPIPYPSGEHTKVTADYYDGRSPWGMARSTLLQARSVLQTPSKVMQLLTGAATASAPRPPEPPPDAPPERELDMRPAYTVKE